MKPLSKVAIWFAAWAMALVTAIIVATIAWPERVPAPLFKIGEVLIAFAGNLIN